MTFLAEPVSLMAACHGVNLSGLHMDSNTKGTIWKWAVGGTALQYTQPCARLSRPSA